MESPSCLFCRIVRREVPATLVHEDERVIAFRDINPQAPVHLLVIPRRHLISLAESTAEDRDLLGHLLGVGAELARREGIAAAGFRAVINTNQHGGQSVYHLHLHILGGRPMGWPPG